MLSLSAEQDSRPSAVHFDLGVLTTALQAGVSGEGKAEALQTMKVAAKMKTCLSCIAALITDVEGESLKRISG